MAHSEDFKKRVIVYKDSRHTFAEVFETFGVFYKSYYTWKRQIEQNGTFTLGYHEKRKGKIDTGKLVELLTEHPDWYLEQFAELFNVWPQSTQKRFVRMGVTCKKTFADSENSEEKGKRR